MVFAIDEINSNPSLLPNITVGFRIYDSCRVMQRSIEGTMWMVTGKDVPVLNFCCQRQPPLMGIIGDAGSSCSIVIARLIGLYRLPQISYVSTSPLLSDRIQFPSFFRTISSDNFQSQGLAQLLLQFRWTWVGLLVEDNDYGLQGARILEQELANAGACIAFYEKIIVSQADRNGFHIIQVIRNSTANAIVIFSSDAGLRPLIDQMVKQKVTGKVFIASEGWSTSATLSIEKYTDILAGTIGLAMYSGEMPGFKVHLNSVHPSKSKDNVFLPEFWEVAFNCKWSPQNVSTTVWGKMAKQCTGEERIEDLQGGYNDVTNLRSTYNVYKAVYSSAWALHDLNSCKTGGDRSFNGPCADVLYFQPWQIFHYVKNVRFQTKAGEEIFFNHNGEVPVRYDIVNWQRGQDGGLRLVTVGSYDSNAAQGLDVKIASSILWPSGTTQEPASVCSQSCAAGFRKAAIEGKPLCCFQCVPCAQGEISNWTDSTECFKCPWDRWPNSGQNHCIPKSKEFLSYEETLGAVLTAICIPCSLMPTAILGLFFNFRNTPIVKANNRSLSYLLLLSLTLCFLCSFGFIGFPTPEKCLLRQVAFGITFALCVSCILAKTIIVVIAFNATKPNSNLSRWARPQFSYIAVSVCTFIQVLLCVSWLIVSPPFSVNNIHTQPGMIIVECNEGSSFAFWCMLGYLGLLATISFIVAFLARKLPDSFNETKFITFSMLAFLSVWISFIPAYLSTKGKYMVAMEIFAILASSSALVSCIFFPKCFIILLRPEMNTREHLMGRTTAPKNNDNSKAHVF